MNIHYIITIQPKYSTSGYGSIGVKHIFGGVSNVLKVKGSIPKSWAHLKQPIHRRRLHEPNCWLHIREVVAGPPRVHLVLWRKWVEKKALKTKLVFCLLAFFSSKLLVSWLLLQAHKPLRSRDSIPTPDYISWAVVFTESECDMTEACNLPEREHHWINTL